MLRVLFPLTLLGLALSLSYPHFRSFINTCKYAYTRWDYLRHLGWKANAWKRLVWNSQNDIGRAYAIANYYNVLYSIHRIKTNTRWWEVDYETLFNKKRM